MDNIDNIIYGIREDCNHWIDRLLSLNVSTDDLDTSHEELDAAYNALRDARLRFKALGVVALANSPESLSEARKSIHSDDWSEECEDVARIIQKNIELEKTVVELEARIQSYALNSDRYRYLRNLWRNNNQMPLLHVFDRDGNCNLTDEEIDKQFDDYRMRNSNDC